LSKHLAKQAPDLQKLTFHPLSPDRWSDLEALFGSRGACAGCWDMYWRIKRTEYEAQKGEGNRQAFHSLVQRGTVPGILAYDGDKPVGWCAVEPREAYPALERSRILKPVDEQPVWSITCFFIARGYRRVGLSRQLIEAAVEWAKTQGASIVEGYPKEKQKEGEAAAFAWTGYAEAYRKAGFMEVARRSETRPIMRKSF
jgi:GNAT superfamily N-acetyltransferase